MTRITSLRAGALTLTLGGGLVTCGDTATSSGGPAPCTDTKLFGRPNATTGLDDSRCGPVCGCGDDAWEEQAWSTERATALLGWTLLDPPAELSSDPYAAAPMPAPEGSVCAVVVADAGARTYRVKTYPDAASAETDGALVTHHDGCGLCSSLEDLAVYPASRRRSVAPARTSSASTTRTPDQLSRAAAA